MMVLQCSDFFSCEELPVNYPLVPEAPRPPDNLPAQQC